MTEHGRGAWPVSGKGGTLAYRRDRPGPYYASGSPTVGSADTSDVNAKAVHAGVWCIQQALNRENFANLKTDGLYGPVTEKAALVWQNSQVKFGNKWLSAWGGFGPENARELLLPQLRRRAGKHLSLVFGIIQNESGWDPGAVGYADITDLGLAQINGPSHPTMPAERCLRSQPSFDFATSMIVSALDSFDGDIDPAVASYNLGQGGARSWVKAGKPDTWTPPGNTTPRDVRGYITRITTAYATYGKGPKK